MCAYELCYAIVFFFSRSDNAKRTDLSEGEGSADPAVPAWMDGRFCSMLQSYVF